jgi:hypothetical protein
MYVPMYPFTCSFLTFGSSFLVLVDINLLKRQNLDSNLTRPRVEEYPVNASRIQHHQKVQITLGLLLPLNKTLAPT